MSITSQSTDNSIWVVSYQRDNGSPQFYIYERATRRRWFLFLSRPSLKNYTLAHLQHVVIKARDGLGLPCYMAVPPGKVLPKCWWSISENNMRTHACARVCLFVCVCVCVCVRGLGRGRKRETEREREEREREIVCTRVCVRIVVHACGRSTAGVHLQVVVGIMIAAA